MRKQKHRSLLEDDDVNNPQAQYLLDFLKMMVDATSGITKEYYQYEYDNARLVKCVPMSQVFTQDELKQIKSYTIFKKGQCYKNASDLMKLFPSRIKYCEGLLGVYGIGIEHAFCIVDGTYYIDPTLEQVLKKDVRLEDYLVYGEFDRSTVAKIENENGVYGEITKSIILKDYKD